MSWRRFLRRAKSDRDRREELESYLQIATDENIARGMTPGNARDAAHRKLGNRTRIREEIYRMNTIGFLDTLGRDLRYALRALRHNPTFTAIAVLTLAIGIGANTAVFSVVNGVLIRPLSYPRPEELVGVWLSGLLPGARTIGDVNLAPPMYFTYREQSQTFQEFGVWSPGTASITGSGDPEQVQTLLITQGILPTLGVQPVLGRWFSQADDSPGTPETIILTNGYWQRRFGGDATVIGRTITVDSRPREVIGVMPPGFRFLNLDPELILPQRFDRSAMEQNYSFQGIARLKPGVTLARANDDLGRMLPESLKAVGMTQKTMDISRLAPALRPLKQDVVGDVGKVLWVLMGTLGMVLLIACANVANLLLVRADGRQQELAIRAALGAGSGRIARELLVESMTLGVLGGALGLTLAYGGLRLLVVMGPANLPRLAEVSIDTVVMLFALGVSLLSGLLFGVIPALKYARPRIGLRIGTSLRGGGRTSSSSRERHRSRNTLVVVQVALALVLLIGSGLMIRSFQALRGVQPGFSQPEKIQTVRISIPDAQVAERPRVTRMEADILDKIAAIPGVTSVAFETRLPLEPGPAANMTPQDKIYAEGQRAPIRKFKYISPGLFRTLGTPLIAGRDITWADIYDFNNVAVISENMAREMWGEPASALGKRIRGGGNGIWREIVGVVGDVYDNGVHQRAPGIVYFPVLVQPDGLGTSRSVAFAIRSGRAASENFLTEIRQAIWSVSPNLPLAQVRTLGEIYNQSMARTSFTLVMLAIAGSMALVLGIIGIYGVLSYSVSQRRREIGIRLALGAQPGELKSMFVRHGLVLASIGVAIGLAAAAGLSRLMSSLLFGIKPLDPLTYAAGAVLLGIAAALASYLPARRAAGVDPVDALKAE